MTDFKFDLPNDLLNPDTGEHFTHCLNCCGLLSKCAQGHVVEKATKRYADGHEETIFAYAMCINCVLELQQSLSNQSKQRMGQFMYERTQLNIEHGQSQLTFEDRTANCAVNGTKRLEEEEYMLCAHIQNGKLTQGIFPYMLGGRAMDELMMLMSEETLGFLDDFMGKHFTGPPEVSDILKPRPVLV